MSRRRGALPFFTMAAGLALVAAGCLLPFSGCAGGTSSTGGNPGITLEFRRDGKAVAFNGYLQLVAAGTNPEFYYESPNDGTTPPIIFGLGAGDLGPATLLINGQSDFTLDWKTLRENLFPRERLRLFKASAARAFREDSILPDFNVIVQASGDSAEASGGWVPSLHQENAGYRTAEGDSGKVFIIDLEPGHRIAGTVDGSADDPLALFVPGTPYYALVHAGRFEFVDLPAGRLPLRWVTPAGLVYDVPESLIVSAGAPFSDSLPDPVHAGARLDSIALPEPYPTLAPPEADPAGQYAFSDSVTVTLRAAAGAAIYYTLDGNTPDPDARKYDRPLTLKSSATLKAVAYARGFNPSPMSVNNYVLAPARPVISPGGGRFIDSVTVAITGPANSSFRYTLDGTMPTEASAPYTGPFVLRGSTLVQAIALVPGLGASAVVSNQYEIVTDSAGAPPISPYPAPIQLFRSLSSP